MCECTLRNPKTRPSTLQELTVPSGWPTGISRFAHIRSPPQYLGTSRTLSASTLPLILTCCFLIYSAVLILPSGLFPTWPRPAGSSLDQLRSNPPMHLGPASPTILRIYLGSGLASPRLHI
ncbi:hypothetical protein NW756_011429 [Fusarium oxysporum]|nr:hypothetical protein NW753_006023 [Fusarium oxysporum]KAJ4068456.1 hypothetical protein NW763_002014 [Fusarium oxysporum]KAJ4079461.1 hypothetical protein NW756_011429 [Fusarium oxysporum]